MMAGKRHTPEQIINRLRQAEVEIANGATVAQVCKKTGVPGQTCHRWRSDYGGTRVDHAKTSVSRCNVRCLVGVRRSPLIEPRARQHKVSLGT